MQSSLDSFMHVSDHWSNRLEFFRFLIRGTFCVAAKLVHLFPLVEVVTVKKFSEGMNFCHWIGGYT